MKTETELTLNEVDFEHWRATVTINDEPEWDKVVIDVMLTPDTIICTSGAMPPKTYAWQSCGHVESEATLAAIKYLAYLTANFDRIN